MDNSELDPEPSFSTIRKSNNNELEKPLILEGLNLDDAKNNYLALIHAIKASDVENVKHLLGNDCTANKSDARKFDVPLHHAIEAGNLEITELLLDAGASPLSLSSGKTPLCKVMKNKQFDFVDLILSKYSVANIDPNNKQEFVHFVIACMRNDRNLVEQFIKKGIDVNGILDDYADEWAGHTPLHLSVKYLSVEVVKILLKHNADFTFQDQNGNSPLHLAYYAWKSENTDSNKNEKASDIMYLILAAHTKNINNFVNETGLSHFHIACMGCNATLAYYFLQSGVDVNSPISLDPQSSAAKIPLHLAVEHCRTDIVKILLEHEADVNAKDSNGFTPLQVALQNKFYKIVELLLEFKAIISADDSECHNTIFQVFLDYPKTGKVIDMMFLACQENIVNSVNEDGMSLLHVACTRNNIDLINELLLTTSNVNACVQRKRDKKSFSWVGYTPLHFAASVQNLDAIHVLLEHQADVNIVERRGLTPLWLSIEAQPKYTKIENVINNKFRNEIETVGGGTIEEEKLMEMTELLLQEFENIEVVDLLVKSRSNLNHKHKFGEPLLFAAYQSFVNCFVNKDPNSGVIVATLCSKYFQETATRIMDCLIKHGIDLNARDSRDTHILHIIAHSASTRQCVGLAVKIAEMILKNRVNVNVSDDVQSTPLHLAVRYACPELVECFLKFDADVDAADGNQCTPLHIAVIHHSADITEKTYVNNFAKIFICLFESNCNVNARDAIGQTPLHIAILRKNAHCIVLLLDKGADINIENSKNQNPFSFIPIIPEHMEYLAEYDEMYNPSLYNSICDILLWHMMKLVMIGHPVDPRNLPSCIPSHDGERFKFCYRDKFICWEDDDSIIPRKYTAKLRDELEKLKDAKIDDYHSLYDILGKNTKQMTMHVRNEAFEEQVCSDNLCTRFPNYAYLLKLKFREGSARNAFLANANESLRYVTRTNFPYICVDKIVSYINDRDMKNLILAAK